MQIIHKNILYRATGARALRTSEEWPRYFDGDRKITTRGCS
jgi:hypothetical protein